MRNRRRALEEASLSFLDVISCGFGAIVLLLIIARIGDPSAQAHQLNASQNGYAQDDGCPTLYRIIANPQFCDN